jgi:cell division protein FtsB
VWLLQSGNLTPKVIRLLRELKRRFFAAVPPAIFLAITGYFCWNAVHGSRGLDAQAAERAELVQANARYAAVDAQRMNWETKIADLSGQSIAPDMLDAELRQILNLADPADLVVELPPAAGK